MPNSCEGHEVLQIEIKNLKDDIHELKEDQKSDRGLFLEMITSVKDSNATLKENIVRLTTLMEKVEERSENQDKKIDGIKANHKWAWGFFITTLTVVVAIIKLV
jgi:DnaJ-domain-containing protein 1